MCIRDRVERYGFMGGISTQVLDTFYGFYTPGKTAKKVVGGCLLYTSDAADERSSVDLGGRRIIKKNISVFFSVLRFLYDLA